MAIETGGRGSGSFKVSRLRRERMAVSVAEKLMGYQLATMRAGPLRLSVPPRCIAACAALSRGHEKGSHPEKSWGHVAEWCAGISGIGNGACRTAWLDSSHWSRDTPWMLTASRQYR